MDLEKLVPIIEDIFKKALEEKRYPFGFAKNQGMSNKVATGSLRDSIIVTENKENSSLTISMNAYGQWIQSGRPAGVKGVPITEIIKWIKARKLKGRDKKGRFIKDTNFAFGIQKNIKKFGIRPSNWIDVAIENMMNDNKIFELLGDATYEDLINALEGI